MAGNKSIDGHMTACNDKSGRQTAMQQPSNKGISKKRAVVVAAIATAMAAVATVMQRCGDNATAMVMDSDGWCNGNAMATMVMEGKKAMQRRRNGNGRCNSNGNKWSNDNATAMMAMKAMTAMDGAMATATATDGKME